MNPGQLLQCRITANISLSGITTISTFTGAVGTDAQVTINIPVIGAGSSSQLFLIDPMVDTNKTISGQLIIRQIQDILLLCQDNI